MNSLNLCLMNCRSRDVTYVQQQLMTILFYRHLLILDLTYNQRLAETLKHSVIDVSMFYNQITLGMGYTLLDILNEIDLLQIRIK